MTNPSSRPWLRHRQQRTCSLTPQARHTPLWGIAGASTDTVSAHPSSTAVPQRRRQPAAECEKRKIANSNPIPSKGLARDREGYRGNRSSQTEHPPLGDSRGKHRHRSAHPSSTAVPQRRRKPLSSRRPDGELRIRTQSREGEEVKEGAEDKEGEGAKAGAEDKEGADPCQPANHPENPRNPRPKEKGEPQLPIAPPLPTKNYCARMSYVVVPATRTFS